MKIKTMALCAFLLGMFMLSPQKGVAGGLGDYFSSFQTSAKAAISDVLKNLPTSNKDLLSKGKDKVVEMAKAGCGYFKKQGQIACEKVHDFAGQGQVSLKGKAKNLLISGAQDYGESLLSILSFAGKVTMGTLELVSSGLCSLGWGGTSLLKYWTRT